MEKQIVITTTQVLSLAYATIFNITPRGTEKEPRQLGSYYGEYAGTCCIDYAQFGDRYEMPYEYDRDYFETVVEDGSEGCWIRIEVVSYDMATNITTRRRCGIIKTLSEGREAWKNFGALAGELAYVANNDSAYKLYKRAEQLASENA